MEFNDKNEYRIITFKSSNSGLGKLTATLNNVNGITEDINWINPLKYSQKTQDDQGEVDYLALLGNHSFIPHHSPTPKDSNTSIYNGIDN